MVCVWISTRKNARVINGHSPAESHGFSVCASDRANPTSTARRCRRPLSAAISRITSDDCVFQAKTRVGLQVVNRCLEVKMKTLMFIGIIALATGLLFVGQGSGYIPWPASSFMINESRWVYYGGAIAAVGILLIIIALR
jgi:hypothetical protein